MGKAWRWIAVQVRAFHHDRARPWLFNVHHPGHSLQLLIVSHTTKVQETLLYHLLLVTPFLCSVCLASQRVKCALVGPLPTMPRKRSLAEMETSEPIQKPGEPSLLQRIRNMWEFASVMQYIFTFGKAVKIDEDFDIEVRQTFTACLCTISVDCCGVALMEGIANSMYAGF